MKYSSKILTFVLILMMVFQSLGLQNATLASAEELPSSEPIIAKALYGATVRGGSYADTPASTGSSTIPRETLEAKSAGDMSFSRRSHIEFDKPANVDWDNVTKVNLVLYLHEHTGNGKKDTIEVFKTDKPDLSEENWTWNNTKGLMDGATSIGKQTFTEVDTGSWVEIDITNLKESIKMDPDSEFALALYPEKQDDQGGIKFYSQYHDGGKFTPYLSIYQGEYKDTIQPVVHIDGIQDGQIVHNEELTFTINATDNHDDNPTINLIVNGNVVEAVKGLNTVTLKSGQNKIEISAEDASGNKSETKVFNIELDKETTFPVIADTYTDMRYPGINYNYSNEKGGLQLKTPVSQNSNRKVYLSFDLSNNNQPYVKEAAIQLHINELMGTDRTSEVVNIYEVPDFDETTLTWGNAPENGAKVADASYIRTGHNSDVNLDITNYINQKLTSEEKLGRINFVLQIENGHDQKGAHISSKEKFPNQAAKLKIVEGLPAPTLEVTGIDDKSIYTKESIEDVKVEASSVSDKISVNVEVNVNGKVVATKGNDLYDIPLSVGENTIKVIAIDIEGNRVEKNYTVKRLEAVESNTFYVDSMSGNDNNDGLSENTPWKSLDKLNTLQFDPGTKILFKRGSIWNGQFRPNGSGTLEMPIIVDAYGEGTTKPIINGNGISNLDTGNVTAEGAVHLHNLSYWEINNLEVTNSGAEIDNASRAGIMVVAGGQGYVEHVYVNNVYVHDVNSGANAQKISGGIIYRGDTVDEKGNITNIESGFKDVLVENSHIKNVVIEGLRTKTYRNGNDTGNIRNYDVVFRNNLIEDIFGDGIVISEMGSGGLVEKNIIRRHSNNNINRNYAGLWLYQTDGVIVQYNEVYDGVYGYNDGEAFDFDIGATNNIYQYNYSHHNKGGFLLTMSSAGKNNVFRYNISQNDGDGEETFFVMNDRTKIYNNTIYVGEGIDLEYFVNDRNIDNMFFKNNILYVEGSIKRYSGNTQPYDAPNMANNIIYPASIMELPGSPNPYPGLIMENPQLKDPNAENIVMDTWTQSIWDKNISNFKLLESSPAIEAGIEIEDPGTHDISGTPLYEGKPDIGAHEFVKAVDVTDVNLAVGDLSLEENTTHQLIVTVLPENATNKAVIWSSSNGDVATVDENGLVTAISAGTATIKVTTVDGNQSASLKITVLKVEPEIDLKELEDLIKTAKSISNDAGTYTADSYAALQTAITEAESALATIDSEEALTKAVNALQSAMNALEKTTPSIDIKELEGLIKDAKSISNDAGVYTKDSYKALQTAIAEAESALVTIDSEEALTKAVNALQKAMDKLVKEEAGTKESDNKNSNENKSSDNKETSQNNELPKTATSIYNLLLMGSIMLLIGLWVFASRRNSRENKS